VGSAGEAVKKTKVLLLKRALKKVIKINKTDYRWWSRK
jgi:hypothetical protein